MRIHYLQHIEMEDIGAIADWVRLRGYPLSGTQLYHSPALPDPGDLDVLVIMGGPMNVYEHEAYPWLQPEKAFIRSVVDAGKLVLGICLGAQLIADVLGGPVTRNAQREIGWFPVMLDAPAASAQPATSAAPAASAAPTPATTPAAAPAPRDELRTRPPIFSDFPETFTAFHAHGDTFAIPPGAVHVASSAACANQAFSYNRGRVVGLQFHLEWTRSIMTAYLAAMLHERDASRDEPWVRDAEELQAPDAPYEACHALLFALLDRMTALPGRS